MSTKPRIVAVNGSPNRRGGNTGLLLKMLEATLNEEDIEMEAICLAEKRICYSLCHGSAHDHLRIGHLPVRIF